MHLHGGPSENSPAVNLQNVGNRSEYYYEVFNVDRQLNIEHVLLMNYVSLCLISTKASAKCNKTFETSATS